MKDVNIKQKDKPFETLPPPATDKHVTLSADPTEEDIKRKEIKINTDENKRVSAV